MSVPMTQIRASNARLKDLGPGLVGLFVGGTSGIGESTLKAFARHTLAPRIYVVGRRQEAYNRILKEVEALNKDAKLTFIPGDCSELREIDRICAEVTKHEEAVVGPATAKVNLIMMTIGYITLKGRNESSEGLDRKFAAQYYSRLRVATTLTPLLHAASTLSQPSSVIAVLGGGRESTLDLTDLSLKTSFSLSRCAAHAITMTSLAFHSLAQENPGTAYIHTDPGIVKTGAARGIPLLLKSTLWLFSVLARPWMVDLEESGERHLFFGLSGRYPGKGVAEEPKDEKLEVATGTDGVKGSGAYSVKPDGNTAGNWPAVQKLRDQGDEAAVMKHTKEVFDEIAKANAARTED